MRILIEEHCYSPESLGNVLNGLDCLEDLNHKISICYVGYFYNKEIRDCVFILPKVLMREDESGQEKVFGKYRPEDIIDVGNCKCEISAEEEHFLYSFAVWIYRSILVYKEKNPQNNVVKYKAQAGRKGSRRSYTLIDVILAIIRFAVENANFVATTLQTVHSGRNKINWHKTVCQSQAIMQGDAPIYISTIGRRRTCDNDDELFVIFYSILNYISDEYGFSTPKAPGFNLIKRRAFETYLQGRGRKRLRDIRYKYFSDKALQMWELCDAFFDDQHTILITQGAQEYLLAKDFNIAFEAMIDDLISDKDIPDGLRNQADGKIVDHLFHWKPITMARDEYVDSQKQMIYIGDSKYYKIGHRVGKTSVAKQFTYARNVIQWTIDVFNNNGECPNWLKSKDIRDEVTEGYAIIPNFFISAKILEIGNQFILGKAGYMDGSIRQSDSEEQQPITIYHFKNRLFDRDTLFVFHYDVNFLHVIYLYARNKRREKDKWKNEARNRFRNDIQQTLNDKYKFFAATPHPTEPNYIDNNYKTLAGKIFSPYEDPNVYSIALEANDSGCETFIQEVSKHMYVAPIELGEDPTMAIETEKAKHKDITTGAVQQGTGVILGYYKDDKHLTIIQHTRTYYMRASAINELATNGFSSVKYIMLHNGATRILYEIDTAKGIKIVNDSDLEAIGFEPSESGSYLTVKIKSTEQVTSIDLSGIQIPKGHAAARTAVWWY